MSITEIVELCVLGFVVVAALVYFIVKAVKNKWLEKLTDTIETAMGEAEVKYTESGSGDKKKEYVIEKVKEKCKELNIPYMILSTIISKAIDVIVKNYNTMKGK